MSDTTIQLDLSTPRTRPRVSRDPLLWKPLRALASLQLTVVLFSLSVFLVFAGTLAQIDNGVWTVVDRYFRSAYVWIPLQLFVQFAQTFFFELVPKTAYLPGSFLFPGGWLLGALLLANLLAAHATRFRLTWKRSGVLVIHAGLIVLMVGELLTGLYAVEQQMKIEENQTVSYAEHSREFELAVVDASDPKVDDVVVVPEMALRSGRRVALDDLPFEVQGLKYMSNSLPGKPTSENPATVGEGKTTVAIEQPMVSGVDAGRKNDLPAAYVRFFRKGSDEPAGTYLVARWIDETQTLDAGDKKYKLELRPKRIYKPYTIHLIDVRSDFYVGTEKPKNYSSLVRLEDPERGITREALISMNAPLRYAGETFYQHQFEARPDTELTGLQVVDNPAWQLPYLSCGLVTLGMLVHFGMGLTTFLRRREAP